MRQTLENSCRIFEMYAPYMLGLSFAPYLLRPIVRALSCLGAGMLYNIMY